LKWAIEFEDYNQPFTLTFSPWSGSLLKVCSQLRSECFDISKGQESASSSKFANFNFEVERCSHLCHRWRLPAAFIELICSGKRVASLTVHIRCKAGIFGVDPLTLDLVVDEGASYLWRVDWMQGFAFLQY
jgi:hypothetical protein